jgi:hypothetical protein
MEQGRETRLATDGLGDAVRSDGGLFACKPAWHVSWQPADDYVTLDGDFTADDLEAIAAHMLGRGRSAVATRLPRRSAEERERLMAFRRAKGPPPSPIEELGVAFDKFWRELVKSLKSEEIIEWISDRLRRPRR